MDSGIAERLPHHYMCVMAVDDNGCSNLHMHGSNFEIERYSDPRNADEDVDNVESNNESSLSSNSGPFSWQPASITCGD